MFHYRAGDQFVTHRFAESTIATLRSSLALTRQVASLVKSDEVKKDGAEKKDDVAKIVQGLDFAAFDCYSCHHDLVYPSERQARGYDGIPGRPQFRAAPFALARVVVSHAAKMTNGQALAGKDLELDSLQKKLAKAFGSNTFGNPAEIEDVATEIMVWSATTQKTLATLEYSRKDTYDLLSLTIEAATRETDPTKPKAPTSQRAVADPEVAQLYAWAVETLVLELAGPPAKPKDDGPPKPPDSVLKLRKRLNDVVVTSLRPHAPFHYEQPAEGGVPAPTLQSVDKRLPERMKTFNSFRGETFRAAFKGLDLPKP